MRISVLIIATVLLALTSPVMAEQAATPGAPKLESSAKVLPLKGTSAGNPCAAYGPGFVKLNGTDTCVHVGGSMSIGARGAR